MHELVLEVRDLAQSTDFYANVIGLQEVVRWTGEREAVWFDAGDTIAIGLWTEKTGGAAAIHQGRGGSHVHFALRIPQRTIDDAESHLRELGYDITRVDFDDGNRSVYVNDPDGNCVELMDAVVDWSLQPIPATPSS
jgi:catechol-2,3-dioxygenase